MLDYTLYLAGQRASEIYLLSTPQRVVSQAPQYVIAAGEVLAALYEDPGSRMLVIAGSNDWQDWLQNLQAVPDRRLQQAHFGIAQHARKLVEHLERLGLDYLQDKPLYLAGHSLGGAVATLLPLLRSELRPEAVLTFGAPAVFRNRQLNYPYPVVRTCFEFDFVPDLPLQWGHYLLGTWRHTPGEVRYFNESGERVTPGAGYSLSRRWRRFWHVLDFRLEGHCLANKWSPRWSFLKAVNHYHDHRRYAQLYPLPVVP